MQAEGLKRSFTKTPSPVPPPIVEEPKEPAKAMPSHLGIAVHDDDRLYV